MLDVITSRFPSLSKSSTIVPPASDETFRPARAATSVNRPMAPVDAKADGGISCAGGTDEG